MQRFPLVGKSLVPKNVLFPNRYMTVSKPAFFKPRVLLKPRVFLGLAISAALSLTGCHGKQADVVAEPVAQPTSRVSDEATKQLPADLYKGMPIFPGAVVEHVRKPKGAMREVLFELKNSPSLDEMVNYYKDGLKKGDFKITSMLIMRGRKTWSCDFHKDGRPGSVMFYPDDNDKSATTIDLIYEMASNVDPSLLEPKEDFDVIGPGPPGVTPVADNGSNNSQDKATSKK